MREIETIGNIFLVKSKVPIIVLITPVLLVVITAFLKLFLINQPIIKEISLENIIWPFIAYAIFLIFKRKNSLKEIMSYFRFNFILMKCMIMEMVLSLFMWYIFQNSVFKYVVVITWFFSGFLRILIQKTSALFHYDITKLLHVTEIYGYTRVSTYFLVTLYFLTVAQNFLNNLYLILILLIPSIVIYYYYISNLYPYVRKHIDVRRTIELLREIGENNPTRNKLLTTIQMSEQNLNETLKRLQACNYIKKVRRYELKEEYIKIKDSL